MAQMREDAMRNRIGRGSSYAAIALLSLFATLSTRAEAAPPLAQWVQFGGNGFEARAATEEPACPAIVIDGKGRRMSERAAPALGFDVRICAAPLPADTHTAVIEEAALPLPRAPQRILVVGDTGCRIKLMIVPLIQPCNDPTAWPWPQLAATAAALKPDLVLHVGDYYYREDACPAGIAGCAGSPSGDNWSSWRADFFTPAAPLLRGAPWVFVRGNHEDCHRGGAGWTRLLDPGGYDPATPCIAHDPLYVVKLGGLSLAILDSSYAPDPTVDPRLLPVYQPEFASLAKLEAPVWLVTHRPLFGVVRALDSGRALGGNATLVAALGGDLPPSVELLLAGHIHILEVMNFAGPTPPQLVAGFSGDMLDKEAPASLDGLQTGGRKIAQGFSLGGFGFVLLERSSAGWEAAIHDASGKLLRSCRLADHRLDCAGG
jgi:hypothetical protein